MSSPMKRVNEVVSASMGNYLTNFKSWNPVTYNVLEYGIVGDGLTDNTAALQKLIDLAISEGRKAIYFPHGQYYVTSLTGDEQVVFFGDNATFVGGYSGPIYQMGDWATNEQLADISLNVKTYGARGNGISDDTGAIQTAIDTANALGGGVVFFPKGIYPITSNIITYSNVYLTGQGVNSVLKFKNAQLKNYNNTGKNIGIIDLNLEFDITSSAVIFLINFAGVSGSNLSDIEISGCTLNGNQVGAGCIYVEYCNRLRIGNNLIEKSGNSDSVVVYDTVDAIINNNFVMNSGRSGIKLFRNCENVVIEKNIVESFMLRREVEDGGIDSYGPNNVNVKIIGNTIDTGTEPAYTTGKHSCIRVNGGIDYIIENNTLITRSSTVGQIVRFADRDGIHADNVVFINNIMEVRTNADYVFRILNCVRSTIQGNKIALTSGISIGSFLEIRASTELLIFNNNEVNMSSVSAFLVVCFGGITTDVLRIQGNKLKNMASLILSTASATVNKAFITENNYESATSVNAIYVYTTILNLIASNNYLKSTGTAIANTSNGVTVEAISNNIDA